MRLKSNAITFLSVIFNVIINKETYARKMRSICAKNTRSNCDNHWLSRSHTWVVRKTSKMPVKKKARLIRKKETLK